MFIEEKVRINGNGMGTIWELSGIDYGNETVFVSKYNEKKGVK